MMKRTVRKIVFWLHLFIGLAAGGVIAIVAFTGAAMAFEPQILAWAERDLRVVDPPPGATVLPVGTLLKHAREFNAEARPAGVTLFSDPARTAIVSLGRAGSLYVNPYTGEVKAGRRDGARGFFNLMLRWHRWLSFTNPAQAAAQSSQEGPAATTAQTAPAEPGGIKWRDFGRSLVGAATIVFLTLSVSGLYLWWPKAWTVRILKTVGAINFKLRGKARDWNWHNAIGVWTAPVIIVLAFTGIVMAYRPVGNWIFQRPQGQAQNALPEGVKISQPMDGARPLNREALFSAVKRVMPQWATISHRMPQSPPQQGQRSQGAAAGGDGQDAPARGAQPAIFSVREIGSWTAVPTQLWLDPHTGAELHREGLSDYSFRRALRTLNLAIHNGTIGGIGGQIIVFLGCIGGLVLVYTGFALSWRRFFSRKRAAKVVATTRIPCPARVIPRDPPVARQASPATAETSTALELR